MHFYPSQPAAIAERLAICVQTGDNPNRGYSDS